VLIENQILRDLVLSRMSPETKSVPQPPGMKPQREKIINTDQLAEQSILETLEQIETSSVMSMGVEQTSSFTISLTPKQSPTSPSLSQSIMFSPTEVEDVIPEKLMIDPTSINPSSSVEMSFSRRDMNKEESLEKDFEILEFLEDSSVESLEEHEMNSEDEVDQVEGSGKSVRDL